MKRLLQKLWKKILLGNISMLVIDGGDLSDFF